MSIELANHDPDLQRLLDKGYALRIDGAQLVVRDISLYLDSAGALCWGALVAKLEFVDRYRVRQDDIKSICGGVPHGRDGRPIVTWVEALARSS